MIYHKTKRNICGASMCRKKHKKMLKQYLISSRVSERASEKEGDYTKNLMKAPHTGSAWCSLLVAWVYFQTHWKRFFFFEKISFLFTDRIMCGWEFDVFSCERERETFFMIYRAFHFYIHMCTHKTAKRAHWLLLHRKRNWITPDTLW